MSQTDSHKGKRKKKRNHSKIDSVFEVSSKKEKKRREQNSLSVSTNENCVIDEECVLSSKEVFSETRRKKRKLKRRFRETESSVENNIMEISYDLPRIKNNSYIKPDLISSDPLHLTLPKLGVLDSKDKKLLQKHKLQIQTGRFNKFENALLFRNWNRYLEDYDIPNPLFLFGYFQYETHRKDVKQYYQTFAQQTQLLLRLAKDLPTRTLYQIYCRARVLLSGLKKLKDFTQQDRDIILNLFNKFGDKYANFCEMYGYNPKCAREVVRNRLKANGNKVHNGPWSHEELIKLKLNVENVMKEMNLSSYDGIPWSIVSRNMNRSDIQCRQRFFTKIMYLMKNTNIDSWDDKMDLAKLIALLKHCNFSDENLIDWDFIKEKFSS